MPTEQALRSEKTTLDDLKLNGNTSESVDFILLTAESSGIIVDDNNEPFDSIRRYKFLRHFPCHVLRMAIMKPNGLKLL
jgi:hypothetical protein